MAALDDGCLVVLAWVGLASVVGFAFAVVDKRRAQRGGRRVRERTLHLLALMGAWPGLIAAFLAVRHKTRKASFLVVFVLAAGINIVLLWLAWRQWC